MYFYIFLTIIVFGLSKQAEKHNNKNIVNLTICLLVFIFAFRSRDVGKDLESVLFYYENNMFQWNEWGYAALARTIRITNSNVLFLLVLGVLIYWPFFNRLWKELHSDGYSSAVLIYMLLFYGSTLNIMRQWIAISIVFWGTYFLKDSRYILFIATVVIATLFHTSAAIGLLYLVVSVFFDKSINKSKKIVSIVIVIIAMVILNRLFGSYINDYINNKSNLYLTKADGNVGMFNISLIIIAIILSILNYFPRFFSEKDKVNNQDFEFAFISAMIGYTLIFLGYFYPNMERISYYYYIYQIALFGFIIKRLNISKQEKTAKLGCKLVIFLPYLYYYIMGLSSNANSIIPYEFSF